MCVCVGRCVCVCVFVGACVGVCVWMCLFVCVVCVDVWVGVCVCLCCHVFDAGKLVWIIQKNFFMNHSKDNNLNDSTNTSIGHSMCIF